MTNQEHTFQIEMINGEFIQIKIEQNFDSLVTTIANLSSGNRTMFLKAKDQFGDRIAINTSNILRIEEVGDN